ncbi:hypothetical protein AMTR_s00085p00042700, partial [Amborella trichopoda]
MEVLSPEPGARILWSRAWQGGGGVACDQVTEMRRRVHPPPTIGRECFPPIGIEKAAERRGEDGGRRGRRESGLDSGEWSCEYQPGWWPGRSSKVAEDGSNLRKAGKEAKVEGGEADVEG